MQINQLSRADTVTAGDLAVIFSTNNGDARAAAMSVLLAYFQDNLTASGSFMTQYASPNATAFNVTISPATNGENVYLLLTPTAGFAAGTITLPALASAVDGQEVLVSCTQAVTTLTVAGNGATVNGPPTTLAANGFFRLRFNGVNNSWYRVG
jgi:hypothetical protein